MTTNIAIAGVTDVGRAFVRHLQSRKRFETNFPYQIIAAYDKRCNTHPDMKNLKVYDDVELLVKADNVDIVMDMQTGVTASYDIAWAALNAGKPVITSNAAMVAVHGEKLSRLATAHNLHFKFSAAVLGGVPVVQSLQSGSESWYISRVHGVLNSTCNYVLKRMKERHVEQRDALSAAVELGYAHANPDMDVSGKDTLYKLALLSAVSYGVWPNLKQAKVTSLDAVSLLDVKLADRLGFGIKHIGMATLEGLHVGPTLMEEGTLIGQMDGTLTGVVVDGDQVGSVFMAGYGADEHATVASLMNDLFAVTRQRPDVGIQRAVQKRSHKERVAPRYYVRMPSAEKTVLEKSKYVDVIEQALSTNNDGEDYVGMVIETNMPREEILGFSDKGSDAHILLDIFRE